MADKIREQVLYDQLKSKHIGLGNPDTSKREFFTNIHRDTYNSIVGHDSLLNYSSIGLGANRNLVRFEMIKKMVQPLGKKEDDEE